jgi:hypothetical protein
MRVKSSTSTTSHTYTVYAVCVLENHHRCYQLISPLVSNLGAIRHMEGCQWRPGFECVICCLHCIMFSSYISGSIFNHSVYVLSHERGPGNGSIHAFKRKRVRVVVLQMISNYLYIWVTDKL